MRAIFRKLYRKITLNDEEYSILMRYAEELRSSSPESYRLFHERFAGTLSRDYYTYLPRFAYGSDDFYDHLVNSAELRAELKKGPLPVAAFPFFLREYLEFAYPEGIDASAVLPGLESIPAGKSGFFELPESREKPLICKYESANPYKEIGLKSHFDRVGRYSFVSRLQSVRYLRGVKAGEDKIEVLSGDCLAGIFTNKEKSIYYYIFLTEDDNLKAQNACRVLNLALYGSSFEG